MMIIRDSAIGDIRTSTEYPWPQVSMTRHVTTSSKHLAGLILECSRQMFQEINV